MGDPQNAWFIMEIPIKIDDLWQPPCQETCIWKEHLGQQKHLHPHQSSHLHLLYHLCRSEPWTAAERRSAKIHFQLDKKSMLVGGWATPLKNISQLGWLFPIYGKIKNVPNHQPAMDWSGILLPETMVFTIQVIKFWGISAENLPMIHPQKKPTCAPRHVCPWSGGPSAESQERTRKYNASCWIWTIWCNLGIPHRNTCYYGYASSFVISFGTKPE